MNRVQIAATVNTHPVMINISAKTEIMIGIAGIIASGLEIVPASAKTMMRNNC